MTIAEKIKMYRNIKCMTQKQLSINSGISEIGIRKYEGGDRNPKLEQLIKIAEALDIDKNLLIDSAPVTKPSTVGDVISIILELKSLNILDIKYELDKNNKVSENSISLIFKNNDVNDSIKQLIINQLAYEKDLLLYDDYSKEDFEYEKNLCDALLEQDNTKLTKNDTKLQ